jgi:hypothetical protein
MGLICMDLPNYNLPVLLGTCGTHALTYFHRCLFRHTASRNRSNTLASLAGINPRRPPCTGHSPLCHHPPSWHPSSTSSSLPSSTSYRTGILPTLTPVRAGRRWHIVCGKPHRPRPPCSSMCYCLARVAFMIYLDRIRWPTIFDVVLTSHVALRHTTGHRWN